MVIGVNSRWFGFALALSVVLLLTAMLSGTAFSINDRYADDFDDGSGGTTGKSGSDGTLIWGSSWSGSSSDGVWITGASNWCASGYCLRLLATGNDPQVVSARAASLDGATSATLTFDHRIFIGTGAGVVESSADGSSYTTLATLTASSEVTEVSFAIPEAHLTSGFHLRFRTNGDNWTDLYIDNVEISVNGDASPTPEPSVTPPTATPPPSGSTLSEGCGKSASSGHGYERVWTSSQWRDYYQTIPENYNSSNGHSLVVGYHGLNYDGVRMRPYLRLESTSYVADTIFVYPDGLNRAWPEFGSGYTAIGWLTGQLATNEDFIFFDDMLDELFANYCIDTSRVYVTGQSWGGDMASSISCARGDKIAATTAVAANGDLFFTGHSSNYNHKYPPITFADCQRAVPMITYRGAGDRYQTGKSSDWWYGVNGCQVPAGDAHKENITVDGRYEDLGCTQPNIYIRYSNDWPYMSGDDHQISVDFETETMDFFMQHTLPIATTPTSVQLQNVTVTSSFQLAGVTILGLLFCVTIYLFRPKKDIT